jgi:hypothetical protein
MLTTGLFHCDGREDLEKASSYNENRNGTSE